MRIIIPIIVLGLISCKVGYLSKNINGHYARQEKDYKYSLDLNPDSSFKFIKHYFEANPTCIGKWKFITDDTILLECNESSLSEKLSSGYMQERENKVIVLSKKRIKVGKIVLLKERK